MKPAPYIHIAGSPVKVGNKGRQLCAWCGAVLFEIDYAQNVADGRKPWDVGALVAIRGTMAHTVTHETGTSLPAECCAPDTAMPKVRRVGGVSTSQEPRRANLKLVPPKP